MQTYREEFVPSNTLGITPKMQTTQPQPQPQLQWQAPLLLAGVREKARQFTATDWEVYRLEITNLYENGTLESLMKYMRDKHGLQATPKQFKDRIKKWGLNKNIQPIEMEAMIRKRRERRLKSNKPSAFRVRNRPVNSERINRYLREHPTGRLTADKDTNMDTSIDSAATPEDISCYTPPDSGLLTPRTALSPIAGSGGQALPNEGINGSSNKRVQIQITIPLEVKLPPIINGVETIEDRVFFEHFLLRLSKTLSVYGRNGFRDLLLPIAADHVGLMHSLLALSGSSIDFNEPYGAALLASHPRATLNTLWFKSVQHKGQAMRDLRDGLELLQHQHNQPEGWLPRYGQILCLFLLGIVQHQPTCEHRIHLRGYHKLSETTSLETTPLTEFIDEYFKFQNAIDKLTYLPQGPESLAGLIDDWRTESFKNRAGLYRYLWETCIIRNQIRINMTNGRDPVISCELIYTAANIHTGIQQWRYSWADTEDSARSVQGLLHKQMIWIYLWRTIYPPRKPSWLVHPRIREAVDYGISLLASALSHDPSQSMLLAPAFIIGCGAFDTTQRKPVRQSIEMIRIYTDSRNASRAVEVLEEVWRRMDEKDERSWDWERIAYEMGMDFLLI